MIRVSRYHDISCGHRVVGHEGKCQHLHGHNYRIHFTCALSNEPPHAPPQTEMFDQELPVPGPYLDEIGRVVDFGVIKSRLCSWLETNWDHKFLIWNQDPLLQLLGENMKMENMTGSVSRLAELFFESFVAVPFNPTAENMAQFLLVQSQGIMTGSGAKVVHVKIEETRKCSAEVGVDV